MKDTNEGKKLIVEFLGLIPITYKEMLAKGFKGELEVIYDSIYCAYNTDWNMLMKVVRKVQHIDDCNYSVTIDENNCVVWSEDDSYKRYHTEFNTISAVFKAVVAFIEWYNLNK